MYNLSKKSKVAFWHRRERVKGMPVNFVLTGTGVGTIARQNSLKYCSNLKSLLDLLSHKGCRLIGCAADDKQQLPAQRNEQRCVPRAYRGTALALLTFVFGQI